MNFIEPKSSIKNDLEITKTNDLKINDKENIILFENNLLIFDKKKKKNFINLKINTFSILLENLIKNENNPKENNNIIIFTSKYKKNIINNDNDNIQKQKSNKSINSNEYKNNEEQFKINKYYLKDSEKKEKIKINNKIEKRLKYFSPISIIKLPNLIITNSYEKKDFINKNELLNLIQINNKFNSNLLKTYSSGFSTFSLKKENEKKEDKNIFNKFYNGTNNIINNNYLITDKNNINKNFNNNNNNLTESSLTLIPINNKIKLKTETNFYKKENNLKNKNIKENYEKEKFNDLKRKINSTDIKLNNLEILTKKIFSDITNQMKIIVAKISDNNNIKNLFLSFDNSQRYDNNNNISSNKYLTLNNINTGINYTKFKHLKNPKSIELLNEVDKKNNNNNKNDSSMNYINNIEPFLIQKFTEN